MFANTFRIVTSLDVSVIKQNPVSYVRPGEYAVQSLGLNSNSQHLVSFPYWFTALSKDIFGRGCLSVWRMSSLDLQLSRWLQISFLQLLFLVAVCLSAVRMLVCSLDDGTRMVLRFHPLLFTLLIICGCLSLDLLRYSWRDNFIFFYCYVVEDKRVWHLWYWIGCLF